MSGSTWTLSCRCSRCSRNCTLLDGRTKLRSCVCGMRGFQLLSMILIADILCRGPRGIASLYSCLQSLIFLCQSEDFLCEVSVRLEGTSLRACLMIQHPINVFGLPSVRSFTSATDLISVVTRSYKNINNVCTLIHMARFFDRDITKPIGMCPASQDRNGRDNAISTKTGSRNRIWKAVR